MNGKKSKLLRKLSLQIGHQVISPRRQYKYSKKQYLSLSGPERGRDTIEIEKFLLRGQLNRVSKSDAS